MSPHPRLEELRRRVQADPTSIAFAALAEEYRRAGQFEEAVQVCRAGLVRHPAYVSARVTLGRALIKLNRLEEAEAELSEVLKIAPENLAAIRAQAEIHTRKASSRSRAPAPVPVEAPAPPPAFELDLIDAVPGLANNAPVGVASVEMNQPSEPPAAQPALERFLHNILALKAQRASLI